MSDKIYEKMNYKNFKKIMERFSAIEGELIDIRDEYFGASVPSELRTNTFPVTVRINSAAEYIGAARKSFAEHEPELNKIYEEMKR